MDQNILILFPGVTGDEFLYLQTVIKDLTDQQKQTFAMVYRGKRQDPQTILILTLLGFLGIAGIQRFLLGNIGMGVLYLLTYGLCCIGTVIDLVNYQKMTLEFNQRAALECLQMVRAAG